MIRSTLFILGTLFCYIFSFAQENTSEVYIEAKQELKDGSFTDQIGGSAPCLIHFNAFPQGTGYYHTWRIYDKTDTNTPILKYTDQDITYTFDKAGTYIVKLEVADLSSDWVVDADPISFEIWESYLRIPNYFSPNDSPGINDEFKIEYKSLVKFRCTIFNRWGVKLYQWTDPDQGWDGTYKGKHVKPGVYYCVVEAVGSDGKRYKEMADINILR
ncbi:gliding motility-associated C-terminal domain-containing protein [Dysgonomonas massiliensis]|uniref:gliding motility-associated C-terminal domain-containing protein n=1 Tax=Dysgonomonas massiliensis TaxID=2040292 RepID=UPI000C791993|nr:gliding motility-associated C-terminal domain-containing protein [Dysgonomonas massiliensis]